MINYESVKNINKLEKNILEEKIIKPNIETYLRSMFEFISKNQDRIAQKYEQYRRKLI